MLLRQITAIKFAANSGATLCVPKDGRDEIFLLFTPALTMYRFREAHIAV